MELNIKTFFKPIYSVIEYFEAIESQPTVSQPSASVDPIPVEKSTIENQTIRQQNNNSQKIKNYFYLILFLLLFIGYPLYKLIFVPSEINEDGDVINSKASDISGIFKGLLTGVFVLFTGISFVIFIAVCLCLTLFSGIDSGKRLPQSEIFLGSLYSIISFWLLFLK